MKIHPQLFKNTGQHRPGGIARSGKAIVSPPRPPPHRPEFDQLQKQPDLGLSKAAPGTRPEALHELPPVDLSRPVDELPKAQGILQGLWGRFNDLRTGSASTREVNRARKAVSEIKRHAKICAGMSDEELRAQTGEFKAEIASQTKRQRDKLAAAETELKSATGANRAQKTEAVKAARIELTKAEKKVLDKLLPEAFATVREAAYRATGMYHYDVQSMAGVLMHHGLVAEMYTGEGKTLAATLPTYLNALTGHGYHVVTVNDYLSKRDAEEMSAIYRNLGMSIGILQANNKQFLIKPFEKGEKEGAAEPVPTSRDEAYKADITYGTACEFAFDYLRDNGVRDPNNKVQRPLSGVLLDEVDSLLIDEARTPHIIAGQGDTPDVASLSKFTQIVNQLDWKTDVEWDMDTNWVSLTPKGHDKVEEQLGSKNIYSAEHANDLFYLTNALKARFLFRKDEHYTIIDDEIRTVGHSGHAMMGRRFSHGLHQALESKEGVKIRDENTTSASITMRDYLAMYQRVSGMTGTAVSAKDVFQKVYGLDVARVPTRKALARVDHPDKVFATQDEKLTAFLDDLEKAHETGRPILIGCEWTSTAEELGKLIEARGLKCNVLGAKTDEEEADIIGLAGQKGSITVATTRGGRGVDIKLGGNAKILADHLERNEGLTKPEARQQANEQVAKEKAEVLERGGLLVMSFEHLDSRRRDDQLRGRAGRQGAPGATVFYTSLEDSLFDGLDAVEDIRSGKKKFSEKSARNLTEAALDRSEAQVNDVLVSSLPYDQVTSLHRSRYYEMRNDILATKDCGEIVNNAIDSCFDTIFEAHGKSTDVLKSTKDAQKLYDDLAMVLPLPATAPPPKWNTMSLGEIRENINELTTKLLARREGSVGAEVEKDLQKQSLLQALDLSWQSYLENVNELREGIGWRAIAQKDPKLEFVIEGAELYDNTVRDLRMILSREILKKLPRRREEPSPKPAATNSR